jgi:hypothetical protein
MQALVQTDSSSLGAAMASTKLGRDQVLVEVFRACSVAGLSLQDMDLQDTDSQVLTTRILK